MDLSWLLEGENLFVCLSFVVNTVCTVEDGQQSFHCTEGVLD